MPGTPQRPEHWMRAQPRDDAEARTRYGADTRHQADAARDRHRDRPHADGAETFVRESIRDRYYG